MTKHIDSELDAEAQAVAARASERRSFFLSTILKTDAHGQFSARVRNLSAGGMMIEIDPDADIELKRGDRVLAELRNIGRVKGEIAWKRLKKVGVKFDAEIDPELARKPIATGEGTPAFIKPIILPERSLKAAKSMKGW